MDAGEEGGKEEGDRARDDERRDRGVCKRDGLFLIIFLYQCITCTWNLKLISVHIGE